MVCYDVLRRQIGLPDDSVDPIIPARQRRKDHGPGREILVDATTKRNRQHATPSDVGSDALS